MNPVFLISGFLLGCISSLHCVGMCGPIALSIPARLLPPYQKIAGILLYNAGRTISYCLLGITAGLTGRFLLNGRLQQEFSIAFGILMLLFLFFSSVPRGKIKLAYVNKAFIALQHFITVNLQQQGLRTMLLTGMANGLLPCGMVYFAVTGAFVSGSLQAGILYMLLFGLGTIPLMFAITYFGHIIKLRFGSGLKKAAPLFIAFLAIMLILRGMNLDIPYLSPFFYANKASAINCH